MELSVALFSNLYDAFIGVYFITKFCGKKLKECKIGILAVMLIFGISVLFTFIEIHTLIYNLIVLAILVIYSLYINKWKNLRAIIPPVIFEVVMISASTIIILSLSDLLKTSISTIISEFGFQQCLYIVTCKLLTTFILMITLKFFVPGTYFSTVDLILYMVSSITTIISLSTLISVSISKNAEKYYSLMWLSSIGLVLSNTITLFFLNKYLKNKEEKHELEMLNRLAVSEHKKYERMYESMQIIRHDLKEQLFYIENMFAHGNTESVKKLINEVTKEIESSGEIVHTGNKIIDNLLYSKSSVYPEFRFIITGTISGLEMYEEVKLVSLFSNMIDNAIEGIAEESEKVIRLEFSNIAEYQNITCKNPITHSVLKTNPDLATSKSNKLAHGYGVKSMKKIVESLNGMIDFYEKDNHFCCHIALPTSR